MPERRTSSQDTVPIPLEVLRERLREVHGPEVGGDYDPIPDETPTSPDLGRVCRRCRGEGTAVVATSPSTHAGPRRCPRCGGSKIDPGTPFDPDDPCAGDLPSGSPQEAP
jgi:hypothetical protein